MKPKRPTLAVAFLQNMWVNDPERVRKMIAADEGYRRMLIRYALFAGCLTGRRIKAAFGEDLVDLVEWDEASREIGGRAASAFPADPDHIRTVIEEFRPRVVLTFGKIAAGGVSAARALIDSSLSFEVITGPHPAARHATVPAELRTMAAALQRIADTWTPSARVTETETGVWI